MAGPLTPTALGVSGADAVVRVHGAVVQVVLERDGGRGLFRQGPAPTAPLISIIPGNPDCSASDDTAPNLSQSPGPLSLYPQPQGPPLLLPGTWGLTSLLSRP